MNYHTVPDSTTCNSLLLQFLQLATGSNKAYWWKAFSRFLLRQDPFILTNEDVWKAIEIGGLTIDELIALVVSRGFKVSSWSNALIRYTGIKTRTSQKIEFVMGSVETLFGDSNLTKPTEFLNNNFLSRFGLEVCEPEDAFYLRPHYTDQPNGESLRIGTVLQTAEDGKTYLYELLKYVEQHEYHPDQTIIISPMHAGCSSVGGRWVFRRKQQTAT
jgi:hypothetical protein